MKKAGPASCSWSSRSAITTTSTTSRSTNSRSVIEQILSNGPTIHLTDTLERKVMNRIFNQKSYTTLVLLIVAYTFVVICRETNSLVFWGEISCQKNPGNDADD